MSLPTYCSLQNKENKEYRCNEASKLKDDYSAPSCLFKLIKQEENVYAIQNQKNDKFFQHSISKMASTADSNGEYWKILPVSGYENVYTIQNMKNKEYMTHKASKLHDGSPGKGEYWIIEDRGTSVDLEESFYCTWQNKENHEYRGHEAKHLKEDPDIPEALFKMIKLGNGNYAMQSQGNYEFYQCHITSLASQVYGSCQQWELNKVLGGDNDYTIQNVSNDEYMTSKASELHDGTPGLKETWHMKKYEYVETSNWMKKNWGLLSDKPLSKICVPGSHDSGMYGYTYITKFATEQNTKTQLFDIQMQLMQGIRSFDFRPVWRNSEFYFAHYSKVDVVGYQGAIGKSIESALQQIAAFFADEAHQNELVIINFSHFLDWDHRDDDDDHRLSKDQQLKFVELLNKYIGHLLVKLDTKNLAAVSVGDLVRSGNIIAVFDDFPIVNKNEDIDLTKGLYPDKNLPMKGSYANTSDLDDMVDNQKSKMEKYPHDASKGAFLMELSWQLTLQGVENTDPVGHSILKLAKKANGALSTKMSKWLNNGVINETVYPNILQTDACFDQVTKAIAVSLAICEKVNQIQAKEPLLV